MSQADETLGRVIVRDTIREELHYIVIGFPKASGQTYYRNQMVSINSSGEAVPIAATTTFPLGRVVSNYEKNDTGDIRVAVPFESEQYVYADGNIDEGNLLACSGFDTTSGKPQLKVAVAGDVVVAVCTAAATDTTITGKAGFFRVPFRYAAIEAYSFAQVAAVTDIATADASDPATTQALANANKTKINELLVAMRTAGILAT